jgi:hypothetical protein
MPQVCCVCGRVVPGDLYDPDGSIIPQPGFKCFKCCCDDQGITMAQAMNGFCFREATARLPPVPPLPKFNDGVRPWDVAEMTPDEEKHYTSLHSSTPITPQVPETGEEP